MKQTKDNTISFRVSTATKDAINARAKRVGMRLSDYMIYISLVNPLGQEKRLIEVFEQEREITKRLDKLCKAFSDCDLRNIQFEEVQELQNQIKEQLLLLAK